MKKKHSEEVRMKYVEMLKAKENAKKAIISNYAYISWLEIFTQTYQAFSSDSWLYKKEELSEADYANVEKLYLFFEAISSYCCRFHINIEGKEKFEFEKVHIKHNNVGYEFALICGQGSYVYVCREEPQDNAISFDSIMNNVVPEEFETKEELLQKFKFLLSTMKEADLPSEVVVNTLKKYYNF